MTRKEKMLGAYLNGDTLCVVGKKFGVSRERVRQILQRTPEYIAKTAKGNNTEHPAEYRTVFCDYCHAEMRRLKSSHPGQKQFCSRECWKLLTVANHNLPKKCWKCEVVKEPSEFYPAYGDRPGKRNATCKVCQKGINASWRHRNPEKWRVICRRAALKYYQAHEEILKRNKEKYASPLRALAIIFRI